MATRSDAPICVCATAFLLLAIVLLLAIGGCAHTQTFQLDCVPRGVTIYLDKVPLERIPDSIDLRTDRPHVLFFKGEGYESTMVVLENEETADGPVLSPRDVCSEFNLVKRSRKLEIEVEE